VKKISILQGSLVYTDETSGEKNEAGDLELSVRNLLFSGTDSPEPFKNISFTGDTRCKILKIYHFTLMNLVMRTACEYKEAAYKNAFVILGTDSGITGS